MKKNETMAVKSEAPPIRLNPLLQPKFWTSITVRTTRAAPKNLAVLKMAFTVVLYFYGKKSDRIP